VIGVFGDFHLYIHSLGHAGSSCDSSNSCWLSLPAFLPLVSPPFDGVAQHDPESPESANRQGAKRKAPTSLPGRGKLAKQAHTSTTPQHLVKERDIDVPSSKKRRREMAKTPSRTPGSGGKEKALAGAPVMMKFDEDDIEESLRELE